MEMKKWGSVLIALFFIGGFMSILPVKQNIDTTISLKKGEEALAHVDSKKIDSVEERLKQVTIRDKTTSKTKDSYAVRFNNTIIMGDSLSQAFLDYRLLNKNQVIANRGRRVDNIDEDINKVIQLAPSIVFMGYGMNDLEYNRGNAANFIAVYKTQVQKIKKALPKTKIYVNSILPTNKKAREIKPVFGSYVQFNEEMKKMCEEEGLQYIDNLPLMNWSDNIYEKDGIHPLFPYYPKWLENMAEKAGL